MSVLILKSSSYTNYIKLLKTYICGVYSAWWAMEVIRIDKTDLKYLCRAQNITSHHGTSPGRVITQLSALRGAILPYARKSATRPRDVQSLRRDAAIDPPRSCEKWPRNRGPSRLNRSNRIPRGLSVSGEQSARRWQGAIHVTDGYGH
ncbi:uncharacterized protein LOC124367380 [Homalodisca vitripennis]|uniref:uncharacterized protein LOC124367380 n=1 Tax=Homalodisca vitripennis TaxID=197043 RepID=UPI001EEA5761|nr:uncharacterized protein LOC124367380 [Homalodisca vitripennis]